MKGLRHDKKAVFLTTLEFMLWFFRLLLLIIIFAGIVLIVSGFYSKQYDVRQIEADALSSKITDCLLKGDGIITNDDVERVPGSCSLDIDMEEFYIAISVEDFNQLSNSFGKSSLEPLCQAETKQKYPPYCTTRHYLVLTEDADHNTIQAKLNIFIAVLKTEKNA